jgi:hypothetical protein
MLQATMPRLLASLLLLAACASPAPVRTALPALRAGDTDRSAGFESPPILRAADVVPPDLLASALHEVADEVPTDGFSHRYWISSRFGELEVVGPELLRERVREIGALARLREKSKSGAFARSAARGVASPFVALWNLVRHPLQTLGGRPSLADPLHVDRHRRELAAELGVDPDTGFRPLRRELDRFAWAAAAGGAPFALVPFQRPELAAEDQVRLNRIELAVMGVPADASDAFLRQPSWSLQRATRLVDALAALEPVDGRARFVELATVAGSEEDALGFAHVAELLLAWHETRVPLERIAEIERLPAAWASDGSLVLALDADCLAWTRPAARLADALAAAAGGRGVLLLPGTLTPRAADELAARGITPVERAFETLR